MKLSRWLFVLLLPLNSFTQICTPESVFYDQLDLGATFTDYVISDQDCVTCPNSTSSQIVADNFILTENSSINNICWLGGFDEFVTEVRSSVDTRGDACLQTELVVTVTYYRDNNGEPGAILNSYDVTPLYEEVGAVGPHPVCIFSATHEVIDLNLNTTYWVSITGNDNGDCEFYMVYESNILAQNNRVSTLTDGFILREDNDPWITQQNTDGSLFLLGFRRANNIPVLSHWGMIITILWLFILGVSWIRKQNMRFSEKWMV